MTGFLKSRRRSGGYAAPARLTHGAVATFSTKAPTQMKSLAEASPAVHRFMALQRLADDKTQSVQRWPEEEEELQMQRDSLQRMEDEDLLQGKALQRMEEDEPLQGDTLQEQTLQQSPGPKSVANGGLPVGLRQGIENLSGISMADVRVHRNSDRPAQVGAHAFAQGRDIHLASGQDRHLPHEAWHIVQQAQGRVQATTSVNGAPVNDDPGLEHEADSQGARAAQFKAENEAAGQLKPLSSSERAPLQGFFDDLPYPRAKIGAEVTEGTAGKRLKGQGSLTQVQALAEASATLGRAKAMQRIADDRSAPVQRVAPSEALTPAPVSPRAGVEPGTVMQRAFNPVSYSVDGGTREMHVDERTVNWGGTGGPVHAAHTDPAKPRAIMFETMCRLAQLGEVMGRLSQPGSLWDTGLSVVVNTPWTPPEVYGSDKKPTRKKSSKGTALKASKTALDRSFDAIGGWAGIPVKVVTAAWERREVEREGETKLESAQGTVPYSTFRRLAATDAGATEIEAALKTNHHPSQVWRKMGDDDMPYVNPNAAGPETDKLAEVEEGSSSYSKPSLVTFGYNLTTEGTEPPVTGILTRIYQLEMQLRDEIAALGAPMYPSEPTTFYQPRIGGDLNGPWLEMEKEHVGGSGQQLETAKLARAMTKDGGYTHFVYHQVMVETSAGGRNDALVRLLNGWYADGLGDPDSIRDDDIEARINALDQSALKHNEYLSKVPGNLGLKLKAGSFKKIEGLVERYRKLAVAEAAGMLRNAILDEQRQQRMLAAWQSDAARRNLKLAGGF